ncbi:glycosyltransferase, partial [Microbacterium sp. 3H14]
EKRQKTSVKRSIEKIYINSTLLKLEVDWLHFGFATMAIERELVAKAIGAKMAVSFRGYDINVYPLKHAGCYKKLWQQVDKVHSISEFLIQKAYALGLSTKTNYK